MQQRFAYHGGKRPDIAAYSHAVVPPDPHHVISLSRSARMVVPVRRLRSLGR